ncbi:MAG: TolC family protein [Comamonadaceae bacterium]|nr:MAG: TolC family protein [Comamonadaceae bacterium]
MPQPFPLQRPTFFSSTFWQRLRSRGAALALVGAGLTPAWAQPFAQPGSAAVPAMQSPTQAPTAGSLKQAFDQAWLQQPEARALGQRRAAAHANQRAAGAWTPSPMALELTHTTDRANKNEGQREWEAGVSIPLWLPGERTQSRAVANAEAAGVDLRLQAAQLKLAGALREAVWLLARARVNGQLADGQLASAQALTADVERRWKAGDLARSDLLQAQGTVAAARAAQAESAQAIVEAAQRWRALAGGNPPAGIDWAHEAEPADDAFLPATHPLGAELAQRLAAAQASAVLAERQGAGNPELTLGTTRERGNFDEPARYALNVGLRVPFGHAARKDSQVAAARAEVLELEAQMALEDTRLSGERDSARTRVTAARARLGAADERLRLAELTRELIDKSFRLGESDLPTRLRTTQEASDAARQQAGARIELASAISQWRQALGLLPQ